MQSDDEIFPYPLQVDGSPTSSSSGSFWNTISIVEKIVINNHSSLHTSAVNGTGVNCTISTALWAVSIIKRIFKKRLKVVNHWIWVFFKSLKWKWFERLKVFNHWSSNSGRNRSADGVDFLLMASAAFQILVKIFKIPKFSVVIKFRWREFFF